MPSVSNILNAILNPDFGSAFEKNRIKLVCVTSLGKFCATDAHLLVKMESRKRYSVYEMIPAKDEKNYFEVFNMKLSKTVLLTRLCPLECETFAKNLFSKEALHL